MYNKFRFAAWTASLAVPVVAVVAVGLETGAAWVPSVFSWQKRC